mmetsp:Transcript_11498/g.29374  ORF Transcript_11498/g.29374 Transcript_11498/m.29374 type:complete len:256 (+) Transcript_11498:220-987(+)
MDVECLDGGVGPRSIGRVVGTVSVALQAGRHDLEVHENALRRVVQVGLARDVRRLRPKANIARHRRTLVQQAVLVLVPAPVAMRVGGGVAQGRAELEGAMLQGEVRHVAGAVVAAVVRTARCRAGGVHRHLCAALLPVRAATPCALACMLCQLDPEELRAEAHPPEVRHRPEPRQQRHARKRASRRQDHQPEGPALGRGGLEEQQRRHHRHGAGAQEGRGGQRGLRRVRRTQQPPAHEEQHRRAERAGAHGRKHP